MRCVLQYGHYCKPVWALLKAKDKEMTQDIALYLALRTQALILLLYNDLLLLLSLLLLFYYYLLLLFIIITENGSVTIWAKLLFTSGEIRDSTWRDEHGKRALLRPPGA